MFHYLHTHQTVEAVEAGTGHLRFVPERGRRRFYSIGDGVSVESSEGCVFIGHIDTADALGFSVALT